MEDIDRDVEVEEVEDRREGVGGHVLDKLEAALLPQVAEHVGRVFRGERRQEFGPDVRL